MAWRDSGAIRIKVTEGLFIGTIVKVVADEGQVA